MLKDNLLSILEELKSKNPFNEEITLVGATKFVDVSVINQAISLGLKVVAENQVQEFVKKNDLISKDASQHFIGHLQTNKVKYLVGKVDLIHSVDSLKLANVINERAIKLGVVQDILLEINIGGEISKSGFSILEVENALKQISLLSGVSVKGFMTVLPITDDIGITKKCAKEMRGIFDKFKTEYSLSYLSMGMSGDYKIAIECGSNMIRLGSVIFGKRNYNK
jgi:pyridoxal phosphate enzyme (YggS family)